MKSDDELIAEYKAKEEDYRNRRRKVEQRKKGRQRREDTRRKILIGAERQSRSERDPEERSALLNDMNVFLTRPKDRALFDLPPRGADLQRSEAASNAEPQSGGSGQRSGRMTRKQRDYLESLIRDNPDRAKGIGIQLSQLASLTKEEASQMIDRLRPVTASSS